MCARCPAPQCESYWVAEFFRQASASQPPPAWGATFLCWLKQEVGLGRVLVGGLGLETVVKLNHPAQVGGMLGGWAAWGLR